MSERKQFWIRFASWITFAYILPAVFLIFRFDLFARVNQLKVGGWGVVFIIFSYIFFNYILKTIRVGLPEGEAKQIINGVSRITLPLVVVIVVTYWLSNLIEELLQFEIVLAVCETIAIPFNPFPKWKRDNKVTDDQFSLESFMKFLKNTKKIEAN